MNSSAPTSLTTPKLVWQENGQIHEALWRSENGAAPPRRVLPVDDTLSADRAYRLVCEGTGLLWRGDFQNARHLLQALVRRLDRPARRKGKPAVAASPSTSIKSSTI